MERHAYQEEIAAAAAEEQAVAAIQQERLNMAKALLNKHNPSWFADTEGQDKTTTDAASVEDVKRCATAAAAKQRAAAMALLKEHNADWFGDDTEAKKQKSFALCESTCQHTAVTFVVLVYTAESMGHRVLPQRSTYAVLYSSP